MVDATQRLRLESPLCAEHSGEEEDGWMDTWKDIQLLPEQTSHMSIPRITWSKPGNQVDTIKKKTAKSGTEHELGGTSWLQWSLMTDLSVCADVRDETSQW